MRDKMNNKNLKIKRKGKANQKENFALNGSTAAVAHAHVQAYDKRSP